MKTLRNIKSQPPLSPTILTILIHCPEIQLLYIFLINQKIPFYDEIIDFMRIDSQLFLQILVLAQLFTRIFIVTVLMLRQFVFRDKKSSVEIGVLKFLKVKIKILIVISLYWNMRAFNYCGTNFTGIAYFNIIVTIGELYGTRILNSSFRFEQENLICQKNQSLLQSLLLFPIIYFINFYDIFYAACLIIVRCLVQLYQNFNNIENNAIQYCDYFSPLVMLSFCLIQIISSLSGIDILNDSNILFFFLILAATIFTANCLTQTLLISVPKYHLKKCQYFTKNQNKQSFMQTEGIVHVTENEEQSFIIAFRVLAKVYVTKMKMQGLFVVKQNPYHGSLLKQDQFNIWWQEFNKVVINHRVYCTQVTCPCLQRTINTKQNSTITSSLFLQIMFNSLQKILNSTHSTKLSIIEKYFYIELLQKPIKNYYLLVKLKESVKKSEEILEVELLMDETRQMLNYLLVKEKAKNQHLQIQELINFQGNLRNMKKQFVQLACSSKDFYNNFNNFAVEIPLVKKSTSHLMELKKNFSLQLEELLPKFSKNMDVLTYSLIYYTYFDEYNQNAQKIKSKMNNLNEIIQLRSQGGFELQADSKKNIDVFNPFYGAIKIDLVWRPGKILSATRNICQLLGFKIHQVQGENINKLMPSTFARYHPTFLKNFVQKGTLNLMKQKEKKLFAKNYRKFILPITVYVKIQYLLSESFCANSLIKKTPTKSEFVLLNNYGKIEEISQNIYHLLFHKSLKEDVLKTKKLNIFKMLLSLNNFVKNPLEIDDKVWEGTITTVDNQELLHSYYNFKDLSMMKGENQMQQSSGANISLKKNAKTFIQTSEDLNYSKYNYDSEKCCSNMKQTLKDFFTCVDLGNIRAYKVMYKFYNISTSQFTCKALEIISIQQQIPQRQIKVQLPKEMLEIGELYGITQDQINRMKIQQATNKINKKQSRYHSVDNFFNACIGPRKYQRDQQDASEERVQLIQKVKMKAQHGEKQADNGVSAGSSLTSTSQKNFQKSSIITSFGKKININEKLESFIVILMFLASSFLVIICFFSIQIKPDYEKLQKDNSMINNFIVNFESRLVLHELDQFYHQFGMQSPKFLDGQKIVFINIIKDQLVNSIKFIDQDISDEFYFQPMTLKYSNQGFQIQSSTVSILNQIYSMFLMTEKHQGNLADNYGVIRGHLTQLQVKEKQIILKSCQELTIKIHVIVATYSLVLLILFAVYVLIYCQSVQKQQKIIQFLPFVSKKLIQSQVNFYDKLIENMKFSEEIQLSEIQNIQAKIMMQSQSQKNRREHNMEQKGKALTQKFVSSNQQQLTTKLTTKKDFPQSRFLQIRKGNQEGMKLKSGIILFLIVCICLVVIVQTQYFFMEANNKFLAYLKLKESSMMIQNLAPRTLLTYLINIDKIVRSEPVIIFPQNFYDSPLSEIFNLRAFLAEQDVSGTQMANALNAHLNTQICQLIGCNAGDVIPKETDIYFLIYRFTNSLEYLRKIWSILQISLNPKQQVQQWINQGNLQELFKNIYYILQLSRKSQQQIPSLFSNQIKTIANESLYLSLTLIPLLIISLYLLRQKFIRNVQKRLESIQDIYKQFSWHILSENSYALNYFKNKLKKSKQY